jgi:hypothetical protein
MTAETVPLVLDVYDGAQHLADRGSIVLIPSSVVDDTVNHQAIMIPVIADLTGTTVLRAPVTVNLRPTDDPDISPSGWAWTATFRNVAGVPDGFTQSFALPWNSGATAYLSSVITVENPVTFQAYMPVPLSQPTAGQVPVFTGTGYETEPGAGGGGSGTVTSASVVTANGFTGTVANPTTTPAITLSTTVSGLLKGNGTAVSAAAAGTDYVAPAGSGAALTGITAAQAGAASTGALASEATRAGTAEGTLSTAIGAETTRAEGAEGALSTAVAAETTRAETAEGLAAQKASNLSDLASAPTARANLGLGTAATQASSAFDASGAAATAQTASLQKSSNLSDLASAGTARTNLGLGSAATQASSAFDAAGLAAAAAAASVPVSALPLPGSDVATATTSAAGVVLLDGTAADLQPAGLAAAGSAGKAADAGHAHPWASAEPLTSGEAIFARVAWTQQTSLTASTLMLTYWTAVKTETTGHVVTVTGSGASSGVTYANIGVFSVDSSGNLTLLASTGDLHTTLWTGTFAQYTTAFTASWAKVAGARYAMGLLAVGTTPPNLFGQFVSLPGLAPILAGTVGSQATMPGTVAHGSVNAGAYQIAFQAAVTP